MNIEKNIEQSGVETQAESRDLTIKRQISEKIKDLFRSVFIGKDFIKSKASKFDLEERLNKIEKPFIEIAGPTPEGYDQSNFSKLNKKVFVSNLFPGKPRFVDMGRDKESITYEGKVDFIADGMELPVKDKSLGAIFISGLGGSQLKDMSVKLGSRKFKESAHKETHNYQEIEEYGVNYDKNEFSEEGISEEELQERVINEAYRTLQNKGLLVWQSTQKHVYDYAKAIGFKVKLLDIDINGLSNVVFERMSDEEIEDKESRGMEKLS